LSVTRSGNGAGSRRELPVLRIAGVFAALEGYDLASCGVAVPSRPTSDAVVVTSFLAGSAALRHMYLCPPPPLFVLILVASFGLIGSQVLSARVHRSRPRSVRPRLAGGGGLDPTTRHYRGRALHGITIRAIVRNNQES
jgi:hypothetical protein